MKESTLFEEKISRKNMKVEFTNVGSFLFLRMTYLLRIYVSESFRIIDAICFYRIRRYVADLLLVAQTFNNYYG